MSAKPEPATIREIRSLKRQWATRPGSAEVRLPLLAQLLKAELFEEAVPHALWLSARDHPQAPYLAAWALLGAGREAEAFQVLEGRPDAADRFTELGAAAGIQLHRWEVAERVFRHVLALVPDHPEGWRLLAIALRHQQNFSAALDVAREGEARFPYDPRLRGTFRFQQAEVRLLQGDYAGGLPLLDGRLTMRVPPMASLLPNPFWQGEPLRGRPLVILWEEGMGDGIMLLRFARLLAAQGSQVLVEGRAPLAALQASCPGVAGLVWRPEEVPAEALQVYAFSLPALLKVTLETLPAPGPYLSVPEQVPSREALDRALERCPPGRRLGLVWAGNPGHARDAERSLKPGDLAPLARIKGVAWVGLQKEGPPPPRLPMVDLGPLLADFADTAYVLGRLDGLITVDTSIAHLAGALGLKAWVLVTKSPDWRWGLGGDVAPWYPSLRLWRQTEDGVWGDVIEAVANELVPWDQGG